MVTIDNDDIFKGIITHKKEDIPKTKNFFLKKGVTVNEGDDVLLTGNYTSNGSTNNTTIFKGRIEDIDLQDIQKVAIVSKAEEIDTIKPTGNYSGYTECVLGSLINDYCNEITTSETAASIVLVPVTPDVSIGNWTASPLWSKIDEGVTPNDADYISTVVTPSNPCELNVQDHSLSAVYNYAIYKIEVVTRVRGMNPAESYLYISLYKGSEWTSYESVSAGYLPGSYTNYTTTYDVLRLNQDDLNALKIRYKKVDGQGAYISNSYVKIYYKYYPDLPKTSYKSIQIYKGEKTLRRVFNWAKLQELKTWYLDTNLKFYFNDGDVDSGVNIASTDKISRINGKKQIKHFDKVILLGGMSGGAQITSSAGAGEVIYSDTFANITDQTTLDSLATQILSDVGNYPLTVQMYRVDSTKGFVQPAEEVTIGAGIKYSRSSNSIVVGQYKIDEIKYYMVNGTYTKVDLTLSDGNVFKKKLVQTSQDQEVNVLVTQVAAAEGGEDNTGQNIGVDGVGVYSGKAGVTLQFRNIAPASSKVTVTLNTDDIDLDLVPGEIPHNSLKDLNLGDSYEHITQTQKNALHTIYSLEQHDNAYHSTNYLEEAKVFEQSSTFPGSPVEGQLHYDEDDDSLYRYNAEALAWIEVGAGGGRGEVEYAVGCIIMFSGSFTNNVTMKGWYICDGANGTVNLVDKFVRGGSASGGGGGSDDAVVVAHTHNIKFWDTGTPEESIATETVGVAAWVGGQISTTGVSGVGANKPAYYTLIFIQRIS